MAFKCKLKKEQTVYSLQSLEARTKCIFEKVCTTTQINDAQANKQYNMIT